MIAAATTTPRNTSERTSRSSQSASAPTNTATPTSVATNALRAVPAIPGISRLAAKGANPVWSSPQERICLEERRHGIVLVRPFVKALALGAVGAGLSWVGGPLTIAGALVLACAAFLGLRAAWSWESTRVVVTTEKLYVAYGLWRRRAAGVHLARTRTIEVEQTLLGRLLGYGTLIAGELEVDYVADPWRVWQAAGGVEEERRRRPLADDDVAGTQRHVAVDRRGGRGARVREAHR